MVQDFDIDDFNMLDMKAKKDLTSLSDFENGLLAKGKLIHKTTGLLLEEINDDIRSLKKISGKLKRPLNKSVAI